MDGLTISNQQKFLESGKTASEVIDRDLKEPSVSKADEGSFADTLKNAVNKVNDLQKDADIKMQKLATGESKNIPQVMIATEKADIALRLMVQVRNKIISAYNDIMKMQV